MSTTLSLCTVPFTLQEVSGTSAIDEICRFRARVWQETGQLAVGAFDEHGWRDPIDAHCRHWVVRSATGELLAAGRLSLHDSLAGVHQAGEYQRYGFNAAGPIAAPDRVVVCPSAQGQGLGRIILDAQDAAALEQGAEWAVRQASPGMLRLLRCRGWRVLGPASPDARFPGVEFSVSVKHFLPAA